MASSSSSSALIQKHDVFLSFRGDDTRDNFTSHLYAALRRHKIATYIDYRLDKGDQISQALVKAISESKISVIIFSENYASSTWCLDELVHILSCKQENGQIVVPVFYRVDPSHVRKQQGSYETALAALEEHLAAKGIEKLRRWRRALTTAASLSGWDSSVTKPEAELVEEIVKDILQKLRTTAFIRDEYKHLVGIHKHIEKIESLLCIDSLDVRFMGIWGMAGIGKTTLARVVFDRLSSQFDGCCFVENIEQNLKELGREGLRDKVLSALLEDNTFSKLTKFEGLSFREARLRQSKVLIVHDDLKDSEQLRLLAGEEDWFGPGSRIIITTKDKQVLKNKIDDNHIYEVEGLNYDEALELFNLNAFRKISPTTNSIEIAKIVVNYCRGNPLALNVLASSFGGKSEERWKDALEKLKRLPNDEIQSVLKMSYDGLDRMQKDIFLDIACFFEGDDRDHVERILDACDFCASIGIDDLIDKSLVKFVNNKLKMHSLLQEMGQEIVRQQSIKNPGKRSRIWLAKDVYRVLQDNTGTQEIEGIFFNMSEINREMYLSPTVFQSMLNLRLLKFYNNDPKKCRVCLPKDLRYLPNMLRYLLWDGYPLKALPANFCAEYLIELIMPNSLLEELWSGVQNLTNLRKIDLGYSENLREISSLCEARNLEHVYLEYCGSLSQFPSEFTQLDKLKNLILEGCSSLKVFPELPSNIECLVLSGTEIEEVPSSIGNLTQLHILSMRDCKRLVSLPTSISELKLLFSLSLSGCTKLETFPDILEPMSSLMALELDKTSIEALPNITTRNIAGVERFTFEGHKLIPHNICSTWIQVRDICYCKSIPHENICYMLESSKCLSLLQLKRSIMNQSSVLPFQFFYEKYCPKMEVVSISRRALEQGPADIRVLCNKEFCFYNSFEFKRYSNEIDRDDVSSELKFLHAEIQRRSKVQRPGFLPADVGVCYDRNTEIPKWFHYRFENCSSGRIRLNNEKILTSLLGFAVCVVVHFEDHFFGFKKFRLVCQAHYQLSDGRLLSWDFHSDYDTKRILQKLQNPRSHDFIIDLSAESKTKFGNCVDNLTVRGAVFDFYFVDENNKSIHGCSLKRCGINFLFEKDLKKLGFFGGKDSKNDEFKPSGSGLLDSHVEEDYHGCERVGIVVSISRSDLKLCFHQHTFLFYGLVRLDGRDGMGNPNIKVSDHQNNFALSEVIRVLRPSNFGIGAYYPGSNIPNYFEHKFDDSQMWIDLPPDLLDNSSFYGFVLCAVVEFKDFSCFDRFKLQYQCDTSIAHYSSIPNHYKKRKLVDRCDYDSFRLRLEDKARGVMSERLGSGEYIRYVWTFKLRCVDENCNPLDQDQCEIRTCAIKHIFAHEAVSTGGRKLDRRHQLIYNPKVFRRRWIRKTQSNSFRR